MIAIVFETPLVTPGERVAMVDAVSTQVIRDFAPKWSRMPAIPRLFANRAQVPAGVPIIVVVEVSDEPDALGYHTTDGRGAVVGIVGARTVLAAGGSVRDGASSISACLSHEVLEAHVDPWANAWMDDARGRRQWAFEVGDPVQDGSYVVNGVSVSNFVLPKFFNGELTSGKFDFLGAISKPFSLAAGGYAIVRDVATSKVSQLGMRPDWKAAHGRTALRRAKFSDNEEPVR